MKYKVWQKFTGTEAPDYIVYYDYDLMGRVKREIHEIPMLKRFKHDKFEMLYLYDAVSGKVREMHYNAGKKDQFFHKFAYDAMGNLKYVWTSRDGKHWTLESALKYYPDGKLMRREIRPKDLMLQGLDYAYTLDGWLKAINSEVLENDPNKDGISGIYQYFARDVFSLLLRYYPNDYKPIKPTATPLEAGIVSGNSHLYKPYYTGWISSWSLNLDTLHTAYSFRYDRLGRLTRATTLTGFNGTEWNASLTKNYSTKYSYDLVGNILSLTRYGSDTNAIDVLTYEYYNRSHNNRLKRIIDAVNTPIPIDLETQPANNYSYDPVGNMIEDRSRSMEVFYTYSNKPKQIKVGNRMIKMFYNPSGYRFFKGSGNNKGQVFIYNSQGQLMAKYTINGNKLKLDFMPIYEGTKRLGLHEPEGVKWEYCSPGLACGAVFDPCLGQLGVSVGPCGRGVVLKASKKYELTDHLNNVRVIIRDQRVPVSTDGSTVTYYKPLVHEISDYYPYGWQKILGRYQFGANAGSLFEDWDSTRGTYYTLYRLLDARVARWYQVEPLWENYAWMSGYVVNGGNPIMYVDPLGDVIVVVDKDTNYLFSLDDGKEEVTIMSAKELYAKGIQWFEPAADNYMPLLDVADDITGNENLKHFSWDDVVSFAMKDWLAIDFFGTGRADWKVQEAEGYFLVTVNGKPYWADAIGNLVFGIWAYNYLNPNRFHSTESILERISFIEHMFPTGNLVEDLKNAPKNFENYIKGIRRSDYDRYMALKGALWAANNTYVWFAFIPPSTVVRNVSINKSNYQALERSYEDLCNEYGECP